MARSRASTIAFQPGIDVRLDGTLELTFRRGDDPSQLAGTTYDLFHWTDANVSGVFATIQPHPGAVWNTDHLCTTGDVTFLFQAVAGDANLDGEVSNADLQEILAANSFNNGAGFDWSHGDFDGDRDVDNADLQLMLATGIFGQGSYVAATSDSVLTAVPEPGTLALLTSGLIWLLWRRRRRAATNM